MTAAYRMTPRRRAALRRAQAISARKRKLKRRKRIAQAGVALTSVALTGAVVGHRISQSRKKTVVRKNMANYQLTGRVVRQRGRRNSVPVRKGVFKAPGRTHFQQGAPYYVKRNRPAYDAARREQNAKSRKLKY